MGTGFIFADVVVTAWTLIRTPIKDEKFFNMVEGNRIELSCEVKSIYNFSVMKINNGGLIRSLPKPRIAYKYTLTEGEDIMMLVPGENGPCIQEGKIQFDEEMPIILSGASLPKGTPVFNRNGVWIGSVLYTFEGMIPCFKQRFRF